MRIHPVPSGLRLASLAVLLLAGTLSGRAEPLVDHGPLDGLLMRHVDNEGRVDYRGMSGEVEVLDHYLRTLAEAKLEGATRGRKLAFFINAYNAATLRMILRHYGKIESITQIEKKFGYPPWKHREWMLAGKLYSLNGIENDVLRSELKEPRIHFAIVCASIGCPDLWNRAFSEKNIDVELDDRSRHFFRSPKHFRVEVVKRWGFTRKINVKVSPIFKWFPMDFRPSVTGFIARYAPSPEAILIRDYPKKLKISYLPYDWKLNER